MSDDYIQQVFGAEGYFAGKFENYRPRLGQTQLAYAVDDAMTDGFNLIAEAPTGTGKSFAYGAVAAKHAAAGQRVVIVTANIALQEQLINKDLPFLREVLPFEFQFAMAKGMNNYLCKDVLDENINQMVFQSLPSWQSTQGSDEQSQWDQIVRWSTSTTTGDVSELPFEPLPMVRPKFTISSEDCIGKKCEHYSECYAVAARRRVKNAHVVVTNYHLFFADMMIKRAQGEGVLPTYTHVVFDEGHKAADIARDFMGFRISRGSIVFAVNLLDSPKSTNSHRGPLPVIDAALKLRCIEAADELFAQLTAYYHSVFKTRFRGKWPSDLTSASNAMVRLLDEASRQFDAAATMPGITQERTFELQRMAGRCSEISSQLVSAADARSADQWAYYLEEEKSDRIVLKGKPIDVSDYMRTNLFEYKEGKDAIKSVTVTSATLATEQGDFGFVRRELGMSVCDELTVESPFDMAKNAILVLPSMPSPQSDKFLDAVGNRMVEVVEQADGRTLCLFTSYRSLNAAYKALVNAGLPYTIMKQGDAPRTQLIKRFKEETSSVLLGTDSFWAGVDVPGESLSCVVIDKIPFPNISDPLEDMLKEKHGRRYFFDHSVPKAVIAFRQGVGRLIRSTEDRGVIVMLDCRVSEKNYGRTFTRAFPKTMRKVRDLAQINAFLAE